MSNPFSPETVRALAAQIDAQIASLEAHQESAIGRSVEHSSEIELETQAKQIEQITKEDPLSFLKRFRRVAAADICEEGGALNAQWKRVKSLSSKDVVESFGPYLLAMGFGAGLVESLVVATGVIVIHIGLKAFCEEFEEGLDV